MKYLTLLGLAVLLIIGLVACHSISNMASSGAAAGPGRGMGMRMGPGSGMMARHHATVSQAYAGLTNPVVANDESLARGAAIYSASCATCHGDGGMGDGPAAVGLDPAPAPIAHTSQMLGDDYLFWRISEGGAMAPFNSTMVPWKTVLDEQARWDVINYIRALGSGQVEPMSAMGGAAFDAEAQAAMHTEMLAQAIEQKVLTQAEADLFSQVHAALDDLVAAGTAETRGGLAQVQEAMLAELVAAGKITQTQASAFSDIHDRLLETGLME